MQKAPTQRASRRSVLAGVLLTQAAMVGIGSSVARATDYATLLGAANINATYYLNPNEDVLNDAQSQLDAIGSQTEKLELDKYVLTNSWSSNSSKYAWNSNWPAFNSSTTLVSMAQMAPFVKSFSDPAITSYDLTTYSPNIPGGGDGTGYWANGITAAQEQAETTSFYNLTKYLMQTYAGTGKSFYLSNWEGDGAMVDALPSGDTVPPAKEVTGMIQWLNARQAGIDEARAQFASADPNVNVYGTIEVNHVEAAMEGDVYDGTSGFATVTNDVLPYTTTDFVSYSSYDTQKNTTGTYSYPNAVAYIAAHLPVTAINGQNTQSEYVGEYGTAENYSGAAEVNTIMNTVINTAVADNMPLSFYWEMYSNELDDGTTTPPGGDGSNTGVQGFYFVKPDGTPATAWKTVQSLIIANDSTQSTSGAVERNLHLAYASNFTAPGATLGSAWTTNTTAGAMSVGITNSQVQMTTITATNTPVGQATLNIASILGRGLEVGEYLQFTLNRQNDAGIIGVSAFGVNHGSANGSGSQTLNVYPSQAGYGWTPLSYNGSNNTNPTYSWDTAGTTLGLRLQSADGDYATINYYVDGTYSGSWLYQTTATTLNSFSLFSQSSTANAVFDFNNLAIYTNGTAVTATNYRWDPAKNGSASGGAGTWDSGTTGDMYNGSSDVVWNYATLGDQVSFGGTAGTVTVASAGVTASTMVFNTPNYVVSGGPITMLGNQTINAANGAVTISSAIAGSNGLTVTGTGVVTLGGTNTFTNGLYVSSGATAAFSVDANLGASGQQIFLNGGTLQYAGTTAPTITRTINIGATGGTINLVNSASSGKLVINGANNLITGAGNITKTGLGWLTLYGSNNATGNWNINGGVVEAGGVSVLGTGSVTVNNGGELSNTAPGPISNPITMNTGSTLSADYNATSTGTYSGAITAAGNFNVRLGNFWSGTSQNVTLNGNITGSGSITTAFASGATTSTGTLTLGGSNSGYSGNINVTGGVLAPAISASNVLGTGSINLSGGKLALQGQLAPSGTTPIAAVSVTGFNKDEIFGSPDTSAFSTTTTGADGVFSYFQTGYTPQYNPTQTILNTYTALTNGISGQSLTSVNNNTVYQSEGQTVKTPFALQPFMADNALQIAKGSTGTISLTTPAAYANLAILAASTNAAEDTPNVTINFTDGTSVTTTYKAYDWGIGTDANRESADIFGPSGVARYSPTTSPGWDNRAFGMYETDIDMTNINGVNDSTKLISSLTFAATTETNSLTNVFALSGTARPMVAGGPDQSYDNNVNVTANSSIGVSGSLNAYMGNLSIGTATLTVTSADTTTNPYTLNFQSTSSNGSPTFNVSNSSGGGHGTLNLYAAASGYPTVTNPQVFQAFNVTGGTVAFAAHAPAQTPIVTEVASLSLTGTGTLDLTNNDLVIHNGNLAAVTQLVKAGYSTGSWKGTGIISSTAANDPTALTTVGVILNTANGSTPIYTSFDGQLVVYTDVLVKYTYYGDANLDGEVDGSDYTLIDNGFHNHLTGWHNGDFNYDGVVDGSDYTLIDNAFNIQAAPLTELASETVAIDTALIAGSASAIPEPGTLSLIVVGFVGMFGRRPRRPVWVNGPPFIFEKICVD